MIIRYWLFGSPLWQIFLLFKTLDRSSWPNQLADSRRTYDSLRTHYLRAIEHPDELESSVDPLSDNDEVLQLSTRLFIPECNEC